MLPRQLQRLQDADSGGKDLLIEPVCDSQAYGTSQNSRHKYALHSRCNNHRGATSYLPLRWAFTLSYPCDLFDRDIGSFLGRLSDEGSKIAGMSCERVY